jgi:excisionase family DNA binding protein
MPGRPPIATRRNLRAWEIADLFGVHLSTVLRWTKRGYLPHVRTPSGALFYPSEEIEAWWEAYHHTGAAPQSAFPAARVDAANRAATANRGSPEHPRPWPPDPGAYRRPVESVVPEHPPPARR